ncbi:hypothetical protein J7T55_003960 [Diaporthe amygdali]|uniref:uncharacterized protein n=1 Tax=Phomopsis amygdali TaxID=1214568 RepID=UPI0022FE4254|nr:uncharacterized protein J7T55_003960 [Diaporthe amygdali]KAJ0100752.1 hypothetical protein J7T55_003960 [Diaporthe amygdali]
MSEHIMQRRVRGYLNPSDEVLQDPYFVPSSEESVTYLFQHQSYVPESPDSAFHDLGFLAADNEDHENHPHKRQRIDSTITPTSRLFSRGLPSRTNGEESPNSGKLDSQGDSQPSSEGLPTSPLRNLETYIRPPFSSFDAAISGYYDISSTTSYDAVVPRTSSADLLSPVHSQSLENPCTSSHDPLSPLTVETGEPTHSVFLEAYPPLQPPSHLRSYQPATSPDIMANMGQKQNHRLLRPKLIPTCLNPEGVEYRTPVPGLQRNTPPRTGAETPCTHSAVAGQERKHALSSVVSHQAAPLQYIFVQQFTSTDGFNAEKVQCFQLAQQVNGRDVVMPDWKPPTTRRGPFRNQEKRKETAQVRKIGSCIRCRMQRIRCEANTDAPNDHDSPCDGCRKVGANSKIHRLPCKRWKITEVKLFKPGQVKGLEWTSRWKDKTMTPEIYQWDSPVVKVITMTEGYADGVPLLVRRFTQQSGDRLHRTWFENGKEQRWYIEPFALVDLERARTQLERYLKSGLSAMLHALLGPKEKLLWRTYDHAIRRLKRLGTPEEEKKLISKTLDLWAAVRLTTRSFQICGKETLGIRPLKGKILIPPVMGAQLDFILLNQTLPKLRRETLELLQSMMQAKKQKTWLTTYLVTAMLLHNVALITAHDHSYAKKHGLRSNFARKHMVEQYHLGANIFLAYYHYCNKGVYPFSTECKDSELQILAELDDESINFVKYTRDYAREHKDEWDELHEAQDYGNDYYFIRQLFERNWMPQSTVID